jgi:glycosyltransferase involved in cell wall biosynthesis
VKVAIVVQRYGAEINGGAELHARYVAERLARHVQVEVLTTCATDYVTWRNSLPATVETVHGITVRRFPVIRERSPDDFAQWSERVFLEPHAVPDELSWLDSEGPTSPELISYVQAHEGSFEFFIFFSFRYYHAFHGARTVPSKAILVPTAERDPALGLSIFAPIFRGVRGLMYNSFEERALINGVSRNHEVPGVVVGIGSEIPEQTSPARFRHKFNFRDRFALYVGRIDENKGCRELFDFFTRYSKTMVDGMHLVLIGTPVMRIPNHPRIHHLGFVSDQDKFDALSAAELLVMPSYLESLSMVALEAWALGKPVLANGRCDVLRGQCIRSNAGLYYENFEEFLETLRAIDMGPVLAASLGRNGREYFAKHYSWPVIERKYLDMLDRLKRDRPNNTMEQMPGWFARRRKTLPPAEAVVAALPTGPALNDQELGRDQRSRYERDAGMPAPEQDRPFAPRPQAAKLHAPDRRSARPYAVQRSSLTDRPAPRPSLLLTRSDARQAARPEQSRGVMKGARAERPPMRGHRRRRGGPRRKTN